MLQEGSHLGASEFSIEHELLSWHFETPQQIPASQENGVQESKKFGGEMTM